MLAAQALPLVALIDHTGDLGLEVRGPTRETLFEAAVLGLADVIVDGEAVRPVEPRTVEAAAPDLELLLVRLLREVLYVYDTERWLPGAAAVTHAAGAGGPDALLLRAALAGERLDPGRHEVKTEVKAVTYHGLEVKGDASGWSARVILDL